MIEEEIELGLFTDPEQLGWLSVAMSLSDIAAVGGRPTGVLLQVTMPDDLPDHWYHSFFAGANACCMIHDTFIIGGDTNIGRLRVGSCVLGAVDTPVADPRRRLAVGHDLYVSGYIGLGNQLALASITDHPDRNTLASMFRPRLCFNAISKVLALGGACIDTSDGFIPTLVTLLQCQPDQCGALIDIDLAQHMVPFANPLQLPMIAYLLGEVGDYGLVFSAPRDKRDSVQSIANNTSLHYIRFGTVTDRPEIEMVLPSIQKWTIDHLSSIRGLGGTVEERIQRVTQLFSG